MTNEICLNIRSILMQINNAIKKGFNFNVTVKKEAFNLLLHKGMTFFKDSQVFSLSYFKKVQFLFSQQKRVQENIFTFNIKHYITAKRLYSCFIFNHFDSSREAILKMSSSLLSGGSMNEAAYNYCLLYLYLYDLNPG